MEETLYLKNLVEEVEEEQNTEEVEFQLATVSTIGSTGLTLIFDGSTAASEKEYKVNNSALFKVGDRVKVTKESGSYIVDFAIGSPMARFPIPSGGSVGQFLYKATAVDYAITWGNLSDILPSGSSGQFLKLSGTTPVWDDVLPAISSSTSGQFLKNTGSALAWSSLTGTLPTGGTSGQFLKKSSSTAYACTWATITEYDGPTIKGSSTTTLGFYGHTAYTQQRVSKASTSATLANVITVLNNLLTALANVGLIISV